MYEEEITKQEKEEELERQKKLQAMEEFKKNLKERKLTEKKRKKMLF